MLFYNTILTQNQSTKYEMPKFAFITGITGQDGSYLVEA